MRAGVRGEEDLAAREVLTEALTGRVDATVLGAQWAPVTAAGLPGGGDRRVGVTFRCRRDRWRHQHRARNQCGTRQPYRCPAGKPAQPGPLPGHSVLPK